MNIINIIFFHVILNLIILFFFNYLKSLINVYDLPDNERKIHSKPIPLIGGYIFLFNVILFLILKKWAISLLEMQIILCASTFLLIGILDDKFNLSPYSKFIALVIVLLVFFNFTENVIIENMIVYGHIINLGKNLGLFFSILCVLLFVNAFNLFDGINLQSSLYGAYILLYLFLKNSYFEIVLILIIPLILIIYLNSKNKIFMGDSGTLFLGSIISLVLIANHNEFKSFKVDEIFLLMFLPGIDMLRLFTQRILSGKNPFLGDREHLHHYFLLIYSYKYA
ncbi:MraY family glycosyltransferase, partial [Candidatus Pelagibacter sp.]|nr:MraY family glycosyltransferase [Candidatus Pelagibacter sp.]